MARPLSSLKITKQFIPPWKAFPNSNITQKPLIIYHNALPLPVGEIESYLRKTGVVVPQWRYTMYTEDHFHSTTHEVLTIYSGHAKLCFGGAGNPDRMEYEAEKGDVIVIPAGVVHRLLDDLTGDFAMVGSYPKGSASWDHCRGGEEGVEDRIRGLKWFDRDPIYGEIGPVLES